MSREVEERLKNSVKFYLKVKEGWISSFFFLLHKTLLTYIYKVEY